jgi:RNA polymerase sigma factor (TIGR02999 family)
LPRRDKEGLTDRLIWLISGDSVFMPSETTQLLTSICAGDRSGIDRLMELVYNDFRDLAHKYAAKLPSNRTLQPTEVVHEAFLKLVDQQQVNWRGKSHFFAVGARAMRHILVDYAKRKARQKRGGGRRRIPLDETLTFSIGNDEDVLAIDEALERLAAINEMRAKIVELRFFAGMTVAETAEALGVSKRTVEGHWTYAKAWLRRELAEGEGGDSGT